MLGSVQPGTGAIRSTVMQPDVKAAAEKAIVDTIAASRARAERGSELTEAYADSLPMLYKRLEHEIRSTKVATRVMHGFRKRRWAGPAVAINDKLRQFERWHVAGDPSKATSEFEAIAALLQATLALSPDVQVSMIDWQTRSQQDRNLFTKPQLSWGKAWSKLLRRMRNRCGRSRKLVIDCKLST